ncbi:LpxL/LpxP family Kdo(2)-lipid IV(A) lauroyl/palmitoleoyl acyltransferase [Paraglaciecola arctica]|uniref:LpxL/LpxP family Kdo(2)-lipid IV(A) lauroyl/palmitoleoyl acyltransferase n=1 Tax=Paraglaciecola arctica TaxID=1128911 RepID=UPI001C069CF0|nr:LpxL/LpxP family Kdo(2)-lipid IV(A) lauroyl/palmitoleoyl acyltransferase [Paraglaciecola arctica]MBU3005456.1 LpxL/LpxP family Kdo(2)-lipid IV(A) lauroyl/palmitoleoyl acyltransferase [Paraglaciecola arctica]
MQQHRVKAPQFEWSFLLPNYWLVWLSILVLYLISWLPYKVQLVLSKGMGKLLQIFAHKRYQIAKRNLELSFPEYSQRQRDDLLQANLDHAGMAIFETSMGWWWPNWRVAKKAEFENYQLIEEILAKGKGVLAFAIHNMNLEFACRVMGLKNPSVVFYRKHKNKLMEYMQYHGRTRSNKYMIPRKDVMGLLNALDDGEVCFYLPDQDYGRTKCEFAPLFAVPQVATTTGSMLFAGQSNCETVFLVSIRTSTGYKIKALPGLDNFPSGDDQYDVTRMNQMIEQMILLAPEQYLWMHKRFKTRPDPKEPSLYR